MNIAQKISQAIINHYQTEDGTYPLINYEDLVVHIQAGFIDRITPISEKIGMHHQQALHCGYDIPISGSKLPAVFHYIDKSILILSHGNMVTAIRT